MLIPRSHHFYTELVAKHSLECLLLEGYVQCFTVWLKKFVALLKGSININSLPLVKPRSNNTKSMTLGDQPVSALECQNVFWEFQESSRASLGNGEEDSGGAGHSAVWRKPAGDLCGEAGRGQSCQRSGQSCSWRRDTWGKSAFRRLVWKEMARQQFFVRQTRITSFLSLLQSSQDKQVSGSIWTLALVQLDFQAEHYDIAFHAI